ncbi:hypothetical protein [Sphingomonas sp.]|uniref:hypothetical protein n=1 Tax=Sphingomonas sp. TaxID=28214 RepID=UPI00286C4129|nr:hypothetical protein [Sphingomonas sp.]
MPGPKPIESNRRRWINLGEGVAVVGLIISGLALWNSWSKEDRPAVVVEQARAIPLALRGRVEGDGKRLAIAPVEAGHALESLTVAAAGKPLLDLGNDPMLTSDAVERLLPEGKKDGIGALQVTLDARYIEAGSERRSNARYRIPYRWRAGGLIGGPTLRLTGLTRG